MVSDTTSSSGERPLRAVSPLLVRVTVLLAALLLLGSACSEGSHSDSSGSLAEGGDVANACSVDLERCIRRSSLGDLIDSPGVTTESPVTEPGRSGSSADRRPLRIGMMNQQSSPAGSYAVLGQAAQAAVDFVNSEFGGANGHPLELTICDVGFSAEQSVGCARKLIDRGAVAVLGGVDVFGDGIGILERDGVAFAGGIPISDASAKSANSFQWSGGAWAASLAFVNDAIEHGDRNVSIVHPDFGPINEAARFGVSVLEAADVKASEVTFGIADTDLAPAMNAAASTEPDALVLLGADTGCRSAIKAAYDLDISARKYFLGACATPSVTEQLPPAAVEGLLFNVEGPIRANDPDTVLYGAAMKKFAPDVDPIGAATVSFRSVMNLYRAMRSVQDAGSEVTRESVMNGLRSSNDVPSFMGHPFTCDGRQIEGLVAMCSPQQILVEMREGELLQKGSWIGVGAILAEGR